MHLYFVPSPMEWRENTTHTRIRTDNWLRHSAQLESRRVPQKFRLSQHLVMFQITHADDLLATVDYTYISAFRWGGVRGREETHCTRHG